METVINKVIVGLGNFTPKYAKSRHNAGFMAVQWLDSLYGTGFVEHADLQSELSIIRSEESTVLLVKPKVGLEGMNSSGVAVKAVLDRYKVDVTPDSLVVVYDDVQLSGCAVKLVSKKSSLQHGGIKSIVENLPQGTRFARVRIAVGPAPESGEIKPFVLAELIGVDLVRLCEKTMHGTYALQQWILLGMEQASNIVNNQLK